MRGEVPEIYARSGHGWRLMEARRPRPLTADQICGAFGCVRAWPCFSLIQLLEQACRKG
jgi:hypothetical protein